MEYMNLIINWSLLSVIICIFLYFIFNFAYQVITNKRRVSYLDSYYIIGSLFYTAATIIVMLSFWNDYVHTMLTMCFLIFSFLNMWYYMLYLYRIKRDIHKYYIVKKIIILFIFTCIYSFIIIFILLFYSNTSANSSIISNIEVNSLVDIINSVECSSIVFLFILFNYSVLFILSLLLHLFFTFDRHINIYFSIRLLFIAVLFMFNNLFPSIINSLLVCLFYICNILLFIETGKIFRKGGYISQ